MLEPELGAERGPSLPDAVTKEPSFETRASSISISVVPRRRRALAGPKPKSMSPSRRRPVAASSVARESAPSGASLASRDASSRVRFSCGHSMRTAPFSTARRAPRTTRGAPLPIARGSGKGDADVGLCYPLPRGRGVSRTSTCAPVPRRRPMPRRSPRPALRRAIAGSRRFETPPSPEIPLDEATAAREAARLMGGVWIRTNSSAKETRKSASSRANRREMALIGFGFAGDDSF
jgi:hypothetical protein